MKNQVISLIFLVLLSLSSSILSAQELDRCNPGGPVLEQVSGTLGSIQDIASSTEDYPNYISLITNSPKLILKFSCAIDKQSFLTKGAIVVPGIAEAIKLQIIEGEDRGRVLEAMRLDSSENLVVVSPKLNLPADTKVNLTVAKGLRSKSGHLSTTELNESLFVEPEFNVFTRCDQAYSDGSCDPYLGIYAVFTRDSTADAWQLSLKSNDGLISSPVKTSWFENGRSYQAFKFKGPFQPKTTYSISIPSSVSDKQGNSISKSEEDLTVSFKTGTIPPMVRFGAAFGVLELNGANTLPLTVRNVDKEIQGAVSQNSLIPAKVTGAAVQLKEISEILDWMGRINKVYEKIENNTTSIFSDPAASVTPISLPRPAGESSFEVVGIPFNKPGFYVVEVASPAMGALLKGENKTLYVPTSVLVTNLAVHFKQGRDSSLVWVTDLDSGLAASDTDVSIHDCNGLELWKGKTDQSGVALVKDLNLKRVDTRCLRTDGYPNQPFFKKVDLNNEEMVVVARKGADLSFTLSSWDEGLEPWRFDLSTAWNAELSPEIWTIFDRTLLRQGEVVHGKAVLRTKNQNGLEIPKDIRKDSSVELVHNGSQDRFESPITWGNSSGVFEWSIPANAKLGDYSVYYNVDGKKTFGGAFSVENYKVPLSRGAISGPKDQELFPPVVPIDVAVRYLNGGGASLLPIKVRYRIEPHSFSFSGRYDGFSFAQEPEPENYSSEEESGFNYRPATIRSKSAELDMQGMARLDLNDIPPVSEPSQLYIEMEYRDPNGDTQTVASYLPILPAKYLVGIKVDNWASKSNDFKFDIAVTSADGVGQKGVFAEANLYQRQVYTHRKKLVGGTFGFENVSIDSKPAPLCSGMSNEEGIVGCSVKVQVPGQYILEAVVTDQNGRVSKSVRSIFVGEGDFWFGQSDSDRIDVLPEKTTYEVGETARFQVRTPFKEAQALVTVEREGILEHHVMKISRSNPVVGLKVGNNWGPNVFVSVLTTRGRIGDVKPTAIFDPAKPAFRLGNAGIKVSRKANRLDLSVTTDKDVYQVRDNVNGAIKISRASGQPLESDSEVAIAVIDEGLLQLKPNTSWDILEGMMELRPLYVRTFTSQSFVIGKRHFGLKALPFGGGGGKIATRELFDTLVYWNPGLKLDASGAGSFTFKLNDSLTSFRVVAVATSGAQLFGSGEKSIRVTKDLMLFAGIPEEIREGDKYSAEFTARNSTAVNVNADLKVELSDVVSGEGKPKMLPDRSIALGSEESKSFSWEVEVPEGISGLSYGVSLVSNGTVSDSMIKRQRVVPSVPVTVRGSDTFIVEKEERLALSPISGAIKGKSEVEVTLSASALDHLGGVVDYMTRYPYGCLEQRISKAVAIGDQKTLSQIISEMATYLDRDGLAKFYPTSVRGDVNLTSYILTLSNLANFEISEDVRSRMIQAVRSYADGRSKLPELPWIDEWFADSGWKKGVKQISPAELNKIYTRVVGLDAISRYEEPSAGIVGNLLYPFDQLPTSILVPLAAVVTRTPELPQQKQKLSMLMAEIKKRFDLRGDLLRIRDGMSGSFFWNMNSEDEISMRLLDLLKESEEARKAFGSNLIQTLAGIIGRQSSGRWDTTIANAMGVSVVKAVTQIIERGTIKGETTISFNSSDHKIVWDNQDKKVIKIPLNEKGELVIKHSGEGKPWISILHKAAVPIEQPLDRGVEIQKIVEPVTVKDPAKNSIQDLWKVTVKINLDSNLPSLVVDDPIPPGAVILGGYVGNSSLVGNLQTSGSYPEYEERTFGGYRAYFNVAQRGEISLSYIMRLNTAGDFGIPQTRAEAMYRPAVFGEWPNKRTIIQP